MKKTFLITLCLFSGLAMMAQSKPSKKVSYDLYVRNITVNYTGKSKHAIAINGQIPGPQLN